MSESHYKYGNPWLHVTTVETRFGRSYVKQNEVSGDLLITQPTTPDSEDEDAIVLDVEETMRVVNGLLTAVHRQGYAVSMQIVDDAVLVEADYGRSTFDE